MVVLPGRVANLLSIPKYFRDLKKSYFEIVVDSHAVVRKIGRDA